MAASRSGMTRRFTPFRRRCVAFKPPTSPVIKPDEHRPDDDIALDETGESGRYAVTPAIHSERACDQLDEEVN